MSDDWPTRLPADPSPDRQSDRRVAQEVTGRATVLGPADDLDTVVGAVHAGAIGVRAVLPSAQDDTAARVCERVGFERVGSACVAEASSS